MTGSRLSLIALVGFITLAHAQTEPPSPPAKAGDLQDLLDACDNGSLDKVKALLAKGTPIDGHAGHYGFTPLIEAASNGHLDVLKYLLDQHADIDLADSEGSTPLLHSCFEDRTDCSLALIDAGAKVNNGSFANITPLMYASGKGNDQVVTALLAHKANVNAMGYWGTSALRAASADKLSTLKLLRAAGADLTAMSKSAPSSTYNVMEQAAAYGDIEMIDYLLGEGVTVDFAGYDGTTPLMAAATRDLSDAIEHLIDKGAKPDTKNKKGRTALMLASADGDIKAVTSLVTKGADINLTDPDGETALTLAGDTCWPAIVDFLKTKNPQRTDVHIIAKVPPLTVPTPAHAWALAVAMFYTQTNGWNPNKLGGDNTEEHAKDMLSESWNVHDKASLLRELDDLRDRGHHAAFQTSGAKLAAMTDDEFNHVLFTTPDGRGKLKALRASYLKWKEKSGLAWDICRSANLVNAGYTAGYLRQNEAWDRLMAIAQLNQASFSSWQEMSDNFLDGREIWAGKRDPRFDACAKLLLNDKDPNSPWIQNPWKTDLGATEAK